MCSNESSGDWIVRDTFQKKQKRAFMALRVQRKAVDVGELLWMASPKVDLEA